MSKKWTPSLRALKPRQILSVWLGIGLLTLGFSSVSEARFFRKGAKTTKIIDTQAMNPKVNPCDNFYEYACGHWQKKVRIPKGGSSTYRQSDNFEKGIEAKLKTILKEMSEKEPAKIYFKSCVLPMEPQKNLASLQPFLRAIQDYKSPEELAKVTALLHSYGISGFFSFTAEASLSDSDTLVGYFSQGGRTFMDRDVYFKDEKLLNKMRHELPLHIQRLFKAVGLTHLATSVVAGRIVEFEKALAEGSLAKSDWSDPNLISHPALRKDVANAFSEFPILTYLNARNVPEAFNSYNLSEPRFIQTLDRLIKETSPAIIKAYLLWRVIGAFATSISPETDAESFDFWWKKWKGIEKRTPVWNRCMYSTIGQFEEDFWKGYVNSLPDGPEAISAGYKIIEGMRSEFKLRILALPWMDTATKTQALLKLSQVKAKVGYPSLWKKEFRSQLDPKNFLKNAILIRMDSEKKGISDLGRPNRKEKWGTAPWDINASYGADDNMITIPYATLVPPSFDPNASFGANMGSLGFTVGHELTHGFDNDGRLYDGRGNANDWWTSVSASEFEKRASCLKNQADNFELLKGLRLNGKNTLGENIADSGGLRIAYDLLKRERTHYRNQPDNGFSEEQEFFLSYAQSWCMKQTENSLRNGVISNPHAPAIFRVNGALANMPEFGEAFQCRQSIDKMSPKIRCEIW